MLLGQRFSARLLALLQFHIILCFNLALDLLCAEPEIPQLRRAILFQLCVAFRGKLFEALVVGDDLGNAAVFDFVEQGYCRSSASG